MQMEPYHDHFRNSHLDCVICVVNTQRNNSNNNNNNNNTISVITINCLLNVGWELH
jgi:hypothetical protein